MVAEAAGGVTAVADGDVEGEGIEIGREVGELGFGGCREVGTGSAVLPLPALREPDDVRVTTTGVPGGD